MYYKNEFMKKIIYISLLALLFGLGSINEPQNSNTQVYKTQTKENKEFLEFENIKVFLRNERVTIFAESKIYFAYYKDSDLIFEEEIELENNPDDLDKKDIQKIKNILHSSY